MIKPETPSQKHVANLMHASVNRLAKWRTIFCGWQLGTRSIKDPEAQAVRNTAEMLLIQRAELNAVIALLVKKNKITPEELTLQVAHEANHLSASLENKFPGCKATDEGMSIDVQVANTYMKDWRP